MGTVIKSLKNIALYYCDAGSYPILSGSTNSRVLPLRLIKVAVNNYKGGPEMLSMTVPPTKWDLFDMSCPKEVKSLSYIQMTAHNIPRVSGIRVTTF